MNHILAAIDLGSDTEKIIAYALWLAKTSPVSPAEVDLLYVLDYGFTPPTYLSPYMEKEKEQDEAEIKRWEETIRTLGAGASHHIAAGRLLETFSTALKELRSDVLVIGHKSHLIRPSTSERLIKSLESPLLVVRGEKSENVKAGSLKIKKIICAVDFSDNSKKAFEAAGALAESSSSTLVAVHVVSSLKMEKAFRNWNDMDEADKNKYRNDLISRAETEMSSMTNNCKGIECIVRTGVTYKTLNAVAVEQEADLIVIGARGLSYISGMILGSVTESLIKSSPCPVMIVR